MNPTTQQIGRKQLAIYFAVAFGLPCLMAIPLYFCQCAGQDTSVFANAQMFYPAAGVILAYLFTRKGDALLPKRFYGLFLVTTAIMVVCCLGQTVAPGPVWLYACSYSYIGASLLGWVLLLTEKKEKRTTYGLRWQGSVAFAAGICLLFLALRAAMMFATVALSSADAWEQYMAYWGTAYPWINLAMMPVNFLLGFLPFLGEEYGWRYFLQPRLQQKLGPIKGVLVLGILWGLWHLPLNLFYYSPGTSLQSIASQLIACIAVGVFFAFAYLKTGNLWLPVLLHFLNNNSIAALAGTAELGNQVITWGDVGTALVLYSACFLPFLFSKVFRKTPGTDPAA